MLRNLGGFFGVLWSRWLNLQGVEKPWRFFWGAVVLNRIYLILGWTGFLW
ncbi:MAG: hypothetical protein GDA51_13245 [Ekhidna sp.]|nr:hypothetical protein [Ekhidna sp.]